MQQQEEEEEEAASGRSKFSKLHFWRQRFFCFVAISFPRNCHHSLSLSISSSKDPFSRIFEETKLSDGSCHHKLLLLSTFLEEILISQKIKKLTNNFFLMHEPALSCENNAILSKTTNTQKLFIALKMAYSCCFCLRGKSRFSRLPLTSNLNDQGTWGYQRAVSFKYIFF